MKDLFDLFNNNIDYPSCSVEFDLAEVGVLEDTCYCYVSSTFLNGFINYVTPIKAVMVERYSHPEQDPDHEQTVEAFNESFHSDIGSLPDDVLIAAKSKNDYWFFWYDKDCSDCCIGRFSKEGISEEEYLGVFNYMIENHDYFKSGGYELHLSGWIGG